MRQQTRQQYARNLRFFLGVYDFFCSLPFSLALLFVTTTAA
jgi:hypothetical protein